MNDRLILGLALVASWTMPTRAQHEIDPAATFAGPERVRAELESWRATHGAPWQAKYDEHAGFARFVHGGSAPSPFAPIDDADRYTLARHWLNATRAMHGVDTAHLIEDGVAFLPLSLAGSTDKYTVQFRQAKDGVRVLDGYANVLLDAAGRLLSVDTTAARGLAQVDTRPAVAAERALALAVRWFADDARLEPTFVSQPSLMIDQVASGKHRGPRLAWEVNVQHEDGMGTAEGYVYRVDAQDGSQTSRATSVHQCFDVSGNVKSMATPGVSPDKANNPETAQDMPYLSVTSAQGNAKTDANGNFTIVGATAPVSVTVRYQNGTYGTVNNQAGAAYTLTTNLTQASGNQITMNSPASDLVTSQANALLWIGRLRDWVRSVNPTDATMDFLSPMNVNIGLTCNAYYNGFSTNYYQAGGGCVNTAYSSVVAHETGHWLNDRYGSGNGGDGFGEGNADNFSTYMLDDPIVGKDFCGAGCHIRNANNNRQFCGDCCGGCYGQVHADGEVLMGAMWKVRTRLKNALGTSLGSQTANVLHNAWMNAYNDTQIKTIIETHWLTLDDDDANLGNGTPNFPHIDGGFKDQGFPGYPLTFVQISNVTQIATSIAPGPYTVSADAVAVLQPPLATMTLRYRVGGGPFLTVPMTHSGGATYSAQIPPQACPSKIEYYVTGVDSNFGSNSYPANAPAGVLRFFVGIETFALNESFEGGANGWTHSASAGVDEWQQGTPTGENGDPSSGASGTRVWGTDLGTGAANGKYNDNSNLTLRSPAIDCSAMTDVRLRLNRWLTVESGQYDPATIKVNGTTVWSSPIANDLIDSAWVPMDIDISSIADGNPSVQISFTLVTDVGVTFGGWNVDDVQVVSVGCPTCNAPATYCVGKLNSNGVVPSISSQGTPQLSIDDFVLELNDGTYQKNALVFWSGVQASLPFQGGILCVQPPLKRGTLVDTDAFGYASEAFPITGALVGTTLNFQWWMRDPSDPFTVGFSNALSVQFCN